MSEGAARLVVALGAELAAEVLPGFAEAVRDVYTLEGALAAARALERFDGGRVAVLVSRLPYRCPAAAPRRRRLLTEALLRKRGVRERSSIDVYTPEPFPMPTAGPEMGAAVARCGGMPSRRPGRRWHLGKVAFERYWLWRWFR